MSADSSPAVREWGAASAQQEHSTRGGLPSGEDARARAEHPEDTRGLTVPAATVRKELRDPVREEGLPALELQLIQNENFQSRMCCPVLAKP